MEKSLVIFDCDGVLVDSEKLSSQAMLEMAADEGLALTPAAALAFIRGRKVATWVSELETELGRPLAPDFVPEFRRRAAALFTVALRPVPQVPQMLDQLTVPICTASSAPRDKIEHTLGLTGLLPRFAGRIYSAYEVGAWKPDPGLFLHAARDLGVPADRCVVVEDSLVGVQAAVAAGMTVFGYAPPENGTATALTAAGAVTFESMDALPALLATGPAGRPVSGSISAR
ncbi:HAD family hydrolase [Streptomyces sp. DSM 3412]|uniref:HAD family hydrolase n=1 Tax=Streptomyces gottesmaniae TaxID=3075518 RepID=A0ABU2Z8E3_9ACTN|nr:HAD family hydrolase [Streptomyces sp. DSM 3412]MDT0572625.1 HAD family hydrolase [Streptomyces sp. DSM 3412]